MNFLQPELHGISKGVKAGHFTIPDMGDIIPASLMIHDLNGGQLTGCSYMNNWGCERLGSSLEDVDSLGPVYYEQFFVKDEITSFFKGINRYLTEGDFEKQYNFFQRVKLYKHKDYTWFHTVCKAFEVPGQTSPEVKLVLISAPVTGADRLATRVSKTLEQDVYIRQNYRRFALLTKREKEVIVLMAHGKYSQEIAEQLFISSHTVATHRKNILRKTECKSLPELLRFAMAFDLV